MKRIKKGFFNPIASMLGVLILAVAETSLMTTCWWLLYQPKIPDSLRGNNSGKELRI